MNGNLNFSKNVFGGMQETKIAGNNINSYTSDGGRRSVEEVRESQLNADRNIHPDAGYEYQVKRETPYTNPINNANLTGGINLNNNTNSYQNPLDSSKSTGAFNTNPDMQMDMTRTRIQSMQDLNRRGF